MAQDTITFIDTVIGRPVRLLGYSDGAVVALMVALGRPDLVNRLIRLPDQGPGPDLRAHPPRPAPITIKA